MVDAVDAGPLVELRGVGFSYGNGEPALRDVSLELRAGELTALVGQNGSGKTTLAKHLNGLLRPDRGSVWVAGEDSRDRTTGELARVVGYVFQNPDHQIFLPTVAEEIAYGPRNLGLGGAVLDARVAETLEQFGLSALRDRHPALLGRGLRRRVALASVWAMRPRLLVLDEPTGGLDRRLTRELMDLLEGLVAAGTGVLLITHDMRLVAEHATRLVVLHRGAVIADGPTAAVLGDQPVLDRAGIVAPEVVRLARALGLPVTLTVEAFCEAFVARLAAGRAMPGGGASGERRI